MAILNNNPLVGASGNQGGYNINNSLRFRSSASAYLSRTPASAGNRRAWTWSGWIKRGTLGATMYLFGASSTTGDVVRFLSTNDIQFYFNNGSNGDIRTSQVFRDPSAWYHLVFVCDTANATASNRMRIYVNGSLITAFQSATYPAQNYDTTFNTAVVHNIAGFSPYLDCYLADVNFIDGQALTPSSFGETDTTTGVWKPKAYTSTYGTNGFYLKFSDIATTSGSNAGLGKDFSGNSNYWTTNNISVTSGTTYDAMTDSPTNTSATVANYAVMNPIGTGGGTLSEANLTFANSANATNQTRYATINIPSSAGLIYFECKVNSASGSYAGGIGVSSNPRVDGNNPADYSTGWGIQFDGSNVYKRTNSSNTTIYSGATSTNTYMIAVNTSTGNIWFGRDGTWVGSGDPAAGTNASFTGLSGELTLYLFGYVLSGASWNLSANFGQRPFAYTPPTGFVALNTFNLPTPTILQGNKYMDAKLYTGIGATQTITGYNFQPELVWVKARSAAYDHKLVDVVRGLSGSIYRDLESNTTDAEGTPSDGISSLNSDGFTITGGGNPGYNGNTTTFVAWAWDAGSSTVTNTSGSISSQVRANTTAGFSIVEFTGTGANATVGHGLGVAPKMVIVKSRSQSGYDWAVWHTAFVTATDNDYILLNQTAGKGAFGAVAFWNSTVPDNTKFSLGTYVGTNNNTSTYVAYCFAEIAGFSKFGSYTGNGSADGPFVFTNFQPRFLMVKRTDTTGNWRLIDTARYTYNTMGNELYPNSSAAEAYNAFYDVLSNGFKMRNTNTDLNASGGTYIYMAFASNPFRNSNAF